MKRRLFLQSGLGLALGSTLLADMNQNKLEDAADFLAQMAGDGTIEAASMYVRHGDAVFDQSFGEAKSSDAIFLLASISKPISIAAVMTLYEQQRIALEDPASKFIPEFRDDGRETITMRQLMTHCSGLPDQLPENAQLRSSHAQLDQFVQATVRTPLLFPPGSRYRYSSMGILLATEVAQRVSGKSIASLVDETVYRPLHMEHSALGVGELERQSLMRCQVENAAPESGAGNPATNWNWNWNSDYWRRLGAPWGGAHGSAADVARLLDAFLHPSGKWLKPETAKLMIANHNPPGIRPRGLGFALGTVLSGAPTSPQTFGHGGSTGTLCWADPQTDSIFVLLTTLPTDAMTPHPRVTTSRLVAEAIN